MPSKIQLDENLWFLYVCLQKSDFKAIDFNAVGEATGLKPPAARMRYTRLRRHIVDGTLIGTHGTPFQGGSERAPQTQGKRKKGSSGSLTKEEEESPGFIQTRSGSRIERRLKAELEMSDEYETGSDDEQDEMPLAKRRTASNMRGQIKTEKNSPLSVGKPPADVLAVIEGKASKHYAEAPAIHGNLASIVQPKTEGHSEALSDSHSITASTIPPTAAAVNVANMQDRTLPSSATPLSFPAAKKNTPTSPNPFPTSSDLCDSRTPPGVSSIPSPPADPQSERMGLLITHPHTIKAEDGDKPARPLVKEEVEDRKIPPHVLEALEAPEAVM